MARIKLQKENTSQAEVNEIFNDIKEVTKGDVPAAYRAFGRHTHILQANWNRTKRVLSEGNLPRVLKECIALAVSQENGCKFCVNIHQNNLLNQDVPESEVNNIKQAKASNPQTEFVLQFCVKATKNPEQLHDEDFKQLRQFGYSEEDILEILTVMEMYTGYNKIIVALNLQIDD